MATHAAVFAIALAWAAAVLAQHPSPLPVCPCLACEMNPPDAPRLYIEGHTDGAGSGFVHTLPTAIIAAALGWCDA